ncbi:hypothetical protein [Mesorhizobium sp. B1-1-8]|uniref:hypothetical protein n=1 Tax=Mesorhizobium sp. B1-1-8 TaxID=2589976 RepID=UPI0039AFCFAD
MLAACRAGDAEGAAKLVYDHIMNACQALQKHLGNGQTRGEWAWDTVSHDGNRDQLTLSGSFSSRCAIKSARPSAMPSSSFGSS